MNKTKPGLSLKNSVLALAVPLMLFTSCGDETEGRLDIDGSAPGKVSSVSSTSGPGEVYLTWTVPASSSFMYSKVTYKNAKGDEVYQLFSKEKADENGVMKATISGFISTDPVEFQIYACSVRGNSQAPVIYSATPGAPAFLAVAQSVSAEPAWGGVNVSYSNETVAKVYISIDYSLKNDASKKGTTTFEAPANSAASNFVALNISDSEFINGETAVLSITAQDADKNASEPREVEVRTKKVAPIDRSGWTFPGFADTNDAQVGYSSQEAGGEGASPNGRVIAMLDGNEGSFWHTAWKTASAYPHFFIIDMGEEHEVTNVSVRRRTNNNGTHKGQTFYTCTASNAIGADPNAWNWDNQGWYPFDRDSNKHQVYGMATPKTARYIKAYFAESDKGGNYVMISEFNAYTPAE